jgi:hypothetical protein
MIPHKKNKLFTAWFAGLARGKFRKNFHRLSLTTRSEVPRFESRVPTIVIANHPSWWDALLVCDLSRYLLKREFIGIFDEEQLKRYAIFKLVGGYAVEKSIKAPGSPAAVSPAEMRRFLNYTRENLEGRDRMLWIFAQGDLVCTEEPIRLKRGFAAVAGQLERVQILKMNISYDYWYESKPEVVIDLLPLETLNGLNGHTAIEDLTLRVEQELEAGRLYVRDIVRRRDASRLKAVWEKPAGTNPFYDGYRWFKSMYYGKKFDKSHAS